MFEEQYHCYSVAYADKPHLEAGDKIILPASASEVLFRMEVSERSNCRVGWGGVGCGGVRWGWGGVEVKTSHN